LFVAQAAEQAQVAHEAKMIAFDRQNHMGISGKTVKRIEDAIAAEAATMHDAKGVKAAVNIKENEEKMKQLRVSDWYELYAERDMCCSRPCVSRQLRSCSCL
jgi:nitric oxide synthase-interacting protein